MQQQPRPSLPLNSASIIESAKRVIEIEIEGLSALARRLDTSFPKALKIILGVDGRVVLLGVGKSGIIAKKIAATLASTGTASFFVHPAEAFHGDLGMIRPSDVALMISNSGETEELVRLLPFLKEQQNPSIALVGSLTSTLARHADVALDASGPREACTNNLAPTSSTTAALVMGDAIAVVLSTLRNFQPEDFARFHPGGNLGRRLLTRVSDVMRKENLPICNMSDSFREIIHCINRGRLGLAIVMEDDNLRGVITDGDIRRAFDCFPSPMEMKSHQIMTPNPKVILESERFLEAETRMLASKINSLIVIDDTGKLTGVLQIYDLTL